MLLLTIVILIALMLYLLRNKISINKLFVSNTKEDFLVTVKDRQKIGPIDIYNSTIDEDGKQPKSTWKSGGQNYESCYTTETRNGNTTGRHHTYYCDNGVDAGEVIPSEGLYSIDLTNYTIHPGKGILGTPLTGIHTYNGKPYTLNSDGTVKGEWKMTLSQSKSFCDSLRDKCRGFNMIIPTKGSWWVPRTIFYAKLDEGWEDPDTFAKMLDVNTINTSLICYIKKDVNAVEKAIPQDKLNAVSAKYKNLPTCNWKSANRCIFKDYTYDQSSNTCVSKDGNPAYNIAGYNQDELRNWLDTLYRRDSGANKLTSEAVNVNEYIQRCKEVDGYEFLAGVSLPNPYIPTTKPGDVKGRYVRLTINNVNDNWLNFAELQVISDNRNIAFNKPASASSTYYGTPPSRGNDGNSLGEWSNNSVAHNDNTGGPEYWEVDLGDASRTIDRVIISNRTDCCGGRLNNWLLSIYDYNKNLIWARIYRDAPNPTISIDILNANNDINNIRVKDYNPSRFNSYFHRVSDTEYNSKRGWDGKGCYDTCHKEICESERKKWIGNNNWYGCREYRPGEYEAEQAEKARLAEIERQRQLELERQRQAAAAAAEAERQRQAAAAAAAAAAAEAARNSYNVKAGISGVWGRLGWPPGAGNINGHTYLGKWNNAEQCKTQCNNNKNCDGFSFHKDYAGSWQGTCYSTSDGLTKTNDGGVISMIKNNKSPIIGRSWEFTVNSPNNFINFTTKNNIELMHFNPRPNIIVIDSYKNGWERPVYLKYNSGFPFKVGIKITNVGFEISMNDSFWYLFNHRHDINMFDHINTDNKITDTTL